MYQIMTAGPTQVREHVRMARSRVCTNPDLDREFFDFYKETCGLLSQAMHTENRAFILGGEGILGLEAACASLTEPGDRVLIIDNGIFGRGFADFVKIYGGEPVLYTADYHNPVDVAVLETYLADHHDFKYATVVHCDTPSGVLNDVEAISRLFDRWGILTVCDSVAGMFGEPLDVSKSKIDILCGGSQKALSAPPGLTMLWVSDRAWKAMEERKTPIASFYANILVFKDYYKNQWFPYTMPCQRHQRPAGSCRKLPGGHRDPPAPRQHRRRLPQGHHRGRSGVVSGVRLGQHRHRGEGAYRHHRRRHSRHHAA